MTLPPTDDHSRNGVVEPTTVAAWVPTAGIGNHADRIGACLLAALAAGRDDLAEDLLLAADCVAEAGQFDGDALRQAGLGVPPPAGAAGITVRVLPFALLTPLDRPRLRRAAYRAGGIGGVDEGAAIAGVAACVLAADLLRGFDIETCLPRCHQTLLEEAPAALLAHLRLLEPDAPLSGDDDPTVAVQVAATALSRGRGVDAVLASFPADTEVGAGRVLAATLAAIRDGLEGFDSARLQAHPLHDRALSAAQALSEAAVSADRSGGAG